MVLNMSNEQECKNYVVLEIAKYNDMLLGIEELKKQLDKYNSRYYVFEEFFNNSIFEGERYSLNHIENMNLDDYYVRNIVCKYLEKGNFDIPYILDKIREYQQESEEKENE